jgi:hypothetical protein
LRLHHVPRRSPGVLVEDFTVRDDGVLVLGGKIAEGGGKVSILCTECGRQWASRRDSVADLALFVEDYR